MEKTLLKKHYKTGELSLEYLPKTFIFGYTKNREDSYLIIGCLSIHWFSYNKQSQHTQTQAVMKKLNLFMAITLAIVTTCIILLFFYTTVESKIGWEMVTLFSIIGYLGAYAYYDNYKKINNGA